MATTRGPEADTKPSGSRSDVPYRLPRTARPHRYQIHLIPDLAGQRFSGSEAIDIEVVEATDRIVLNAVDLDLADCFLVTGWDGAGLEEETESTDGRGATSTRPGIALNPESDAEGERVALVAPRRLEPGRYRLSCRFSGRFADRLRGLYGSTYTDEQGTGRVIATTQFEETHARRAFPCFDEPEAKAVFSVTLDAPPGSIALSNGAEVETVDLGDGSRRTRFADTIPMSTYLVAFVVGPLELTEPMDVDGVAVRVAHVPGRAALTGPALDAAAHALRFFASYFDVAYPGDKLDLVALPDFAAGAMENFGCVTFREAILLADPTSASRPELERLSEVVAHEIAHMWFGDLVTMRWWNGLWLNEAFATFMALLCQDDYRPEWEVFVGFARAKATALAVDGLHRTRPVEFPVGAPEEAAAMFDVLTYEKGASVLWMLEDYLGDERFRDGVRRYLKDHAYASTETTDLWDAIGAEALDVPIRDLMDSWIFQGGYPLVEATTTIDDEGEEVVELSQVPFSYLPPGEGLRPGEASAIGSGWLVPVLAAPCRTRVIDVDDRLRVVLGQDPLRLPVEAGPVVVNAGGSGFYRVAYEPTLRAGLLAELETLLPLERYHLVADLWATVVAGTEPLADLFAAFGRLADERDPHVWSVVIAALGLVDALCPAPLRAPFSGYVRHLLGPKLDAVGWFRIDGEGEQVPLLRASLVSALGTFGGDDAVAERAAELFRSELAGTAPLLPDMASAVLAVVASRATTSNRWGFEAIVARYRAPRDPMEEVRYLTSLGRLTDAGLAAEVLPLTLSEIRIQNAPYLLAGMLQNRSIGPTTWPFVRDHLDEMVERYPASSIPRMLEGVSVLAQCDERGSPYLASEIRAFLEAHVPSAHRHQVGQSLERLEVNVRLARRLGAELRPLLEGR